MPALLDEVVLEKALARLVESRVMLAGSGINLEWTTHETNGQRWRKLELPMLGWGVCYARRGAELVVANSESLLAEMLSGRTEETPRVVNQSEPFDELTHIRFSARRQAFDEVLAKLDAVRVNNYLRERGAGEDGTADAASQAFFTGNIGSLLDARVAR